MKALKTKNANHSPQYRTAGDIPIEQLRKAETFLPMSDDSLRAMSEHDEQTRPSGASKPEQGAGSRPLTRITEVQLAERIARQAHQGQKDTRDWSSDYITHIERVVSMVDGEDAKAIAWLHDVLEDTNVSEWELLRAGISMQTVAAVRMLTREDPYEYQPYIDAIQQSGDSLVIAVKLADLRDHLRPNCPARLRPRYEKALAQLEPCGSGDDLDD